jgi:hypothetical protein
MLPRQWKQYRHNREYWNRRVPYSFTLSAEEENKMNSREESRKLQLVTWSGLCVQYPLLWLSRKRAVPDIQTNA